MRAIVRDVEGVSLRRVAVPEVAAPDDVIVEIAVAGVCRTDLRVADGELGAPRVVLGHEAAGTVVAHGPAADVEVGARVTIVPIDGRGAWLGVDRDGVFADRVRVPAAQVRTLPRALPWALGAYVEPVAAALGVLRAIAPGARVLVDGTNRIAALTARILDAHGAHVVREAAPGSVDAVVETGAAFAPLLATLRPGGTLVVKSRGAAVATIDPSILVARELTVRGVGHGDFGDAIAWLAERRIVVEDLLGPARPLEAFAAVLADARASEAQKQLFTCAG